MYTFDIILDFSAMGYKEEITEDADNLLSSLYDSRQIASRDNILIRTESEIRIPVACPELDSLEDKYCSIYALKWKASIEKHLSAKVRFIHTGTEPQYADYEIPSRSSFYFLHFSGFSPLRCGDTRMPVPLYKIPYTYHDNECYNDIRSWNNDYESLYGLWFSGLAERFALRQMQDASSKLSAKGRMICERIENLTGIPTYYFLFNYRAGGQKKDMHRKCPECGNS